MPEYLSPGVYLEAVDRSAGPIVALRTDVAGFVGVAERGPLDEPVRIESWEQFVARFGDLLPNAFLAYAARAFFENGGRRAWFVRVAADAVATASAGPQPPDGASTVVASVIGFASGGVVTIRQDGRVGSRLLRRVDSLRGSFVWDRPLLGEFDPALPLFLESGIGVADAVLHGRDGRETLRLMARDPGFWGNELEIRISLSSSSAASTRRTPQPHDRGASLVDVVDGFDEGTLVRLFQSDAPDLESYRVVTAVDPVERLLTWDAPLPLGDSWSLETVDVGVSVVRRGRVIEVYSGLSPVPGFERSIGRALESSNALRVLDLQAAAQAENGTPPSPWPARLPDLSAVPGGSLRLAGGRDGIAALEGRRFADPADLDRIDRTPRGLFALSLIDEVAVEAIPDLMLQETPPVSYVPRPRPHDPCLCQPEDPAVSPGPPVTLVERSPQFSLEEIYAVQQTLIAHCEQARDRIALLDSPLFSQRDQTGLQQIRAWRRRFDSTFAALYYPWILAPAPAGARDVVRPMPPSGHVAGIVARTDLAVGVHKAPANVELRWAQGLSDDIDERRQELLNPDGINALRAYPGRGLRVFGARTVASDTQWRFLNVRRLLLMIEEALEEALQWTVFEPNTPALRERVRTAVSSFLRAIWERGALAGAVAQEAFFVRCDGVNNPPDSVDAGRLIADVGVAPAQPAEFVIVRIGRTESVFTFEERGVSQ
jgi:phage tail sheath protein FI